MKNKTRITIMAAGAALFMTGTAAAVMQGEQDGRIEQTMTDTMTDTIPAGTTLLIETTAGPVKILLYDDTPQHRDNFVKLADEGFYDGVLFHRVIKDFMVQTGDPTSKNAEKGAMLGAGDPSYTLPAEFVYPKHYHKYGAIAAARTGDEVNPEKRSSGSQFYIVTGKKYSVAQLNRMEQANAQKQLQSYFRKLQVERMDTIRALRLANDSTGLENLRQELIRETEANVQPVSMTAEQIRDYTTIGGTRHLDGEYTVFGEVLEGMDTIEKIQAAETDGRDRPLEDIKILSITHIMP